MFQSLEIINPQKHANLTYKSVPGYAHARKQPLWKGARLAWFARGLALVLGLFFERGLNILDFRLRLGDGGLLIFECQLQLIRG